MALQLSIDVMKQYSKVSAAELLSRGWEKNEPEFRVPTLSCMAQDFNLVLDQISSLFLSRK